MSIELNASGNSSYLHHDTVAVNDLAAIGKEWSVAMWFKVMTWVDGDAIFCIGLTAGPTTPIWIYLTSSDDLVFRTLANGTSALDTESGLTSGSWNLFIVNFTSAYGLNAYEHSYSVNGSNFSTPVQNAGDSSAGFDNMSICVRRFAGAVTNHVHARVAYPALWNEHLTNTHAADMYATKDGSNEVVEPWTINSSEILHSASFTNGTLTQVTGTTGTAWTLVGSDMTARASDNPTLGTSSSTSNITMGGTAVSVSSSPAIGGASLVTK